MCLQSKRTTTFFPLKSSTWLLNSKLMKSPCVPAGIISKCTTVDYAFISGRDGSLTSEVRHQRRIKRLFGVKKFSISLFIRSDRSTIPDLRIEKVKKNSKNVILPALEYNYN